MSRRSSARSMVPTVAYHGAHKPTVDTPPLERWEGERCTAFVHDILTSPELPGSFGQCDVMVTDLPWQNGYDTFNQRAGVADGRTYAQFMDRVGDLVWATDVPLYLVTGKHALPKLPKPDVVMPMMLNQDEAIAIGYRPGPEADQYWYGDTREFLHELAQLYECAGDWCCGYGRTARFFLRAGQRAVLSDINPRCIGYIAEHAPTWHRSDLGG